MRRIIVFSGLSVIIVLSGILALSCSLRHDDSILPVRGFCISAPAPEHIERFVRFIDEELAPRDVNVIVLMVQYGYRYKSHPELADPSGLSESDVKQLVEVCRKNNIRLIPQVNLLGHQSWAERTGKLLSAYPEFDETPEVEMPEKYKWPNKDSLYCKSYCPLHPDVHQIVFDIVDEICDVFESDAFHAGMDEVFYIGRCTRCAGHNRAELFADEVNRIRDHLALRNRELWIWGDRLIDGHTSGTGGWEGSFNGTWPAIEMIKKDIVICDWHYEHAHKTAPLFAEKGLRVITCPWRNPSVAVKQTRMIRHFRKRSDATIKENYQGMMQTVWSGNNRFLDSFYNPDQSEKKSEAACFRALFKEINRVK